MKTIADFIDIAPPTDQEMRRYHSEPEFHARVYAVKQRLHNAADPIKRRMTGIRVRDFLARDAFSDRLFWLALRIVVGQEGATGALQHELAWNGREWWVTTRRGRDPISGMPLTMFLAAAPGGAYS